VPEGSELDVQWHCSVKPGCCFAAAAAAAAGCWLLLAAADDPLLRLRAKTFVHAQRADARNGHTACDVWATFSALERWVTVT